MTKTYPYEAKQIRMDG